MPFPIGESFPERLKAYRMIKGLSQKKLARELGVDETTLQKWESGLSTPSRKLRARVEPIIEAALRRICRRAT